MRRKPPRTAATVPTYNRVIVRFASRYGLHRGTLVRLGHLMEGLRTVGIVEHVTGMGKQRLDVFPDPRGASAHTTQPRLVFGNHARLFDLLEGLAELCLSLHVMPTPHMDDPIPIHQRQA